jgi:hypothetical protein
MGSPRARKEHHWLQQAIPLVYPGHSWLAHLSRLPPQMIVRDRGVSESASIP